ncbi:MAG: hypothetical protein UV36_C0001G0021 [Parcubacteria group bacterium GW2011_GWC2_42_6]|nr:MAG: hypothetical protein UU87_C0003G0179 [Parcubacteria group bacterium GW2011_GWA2_42_11]KKS68458.1 MAG: hypothetical protein UV36_C0001G0021 [Parcubacteria group bacterium GW2011_GWC2_42_6]
MSANEQREEISGGEKGLDFIRRIKHIYDSAKINFKSC